MLWVYDNAITADLASCIDPTGGANNTVKVMGEEGMMGILAQLQDDTIKFPAIFLERIEDTPLDSRRANFTRLHKGVPAVFDTVENNIYLERCAPIELKYNAHVLATNTADRDEAVRELVFRYSSMYYITTQVPYESKRKIRFGVAINPDNNIRQKSGTSDYVSTGKLYEAILELNCEGAVLLHYTKRHLQGIVTSNAIQLK